MIADWVREHHGIVPSTQLFHAHGQRLHLATPDGIALRPGGRVELAEIKTTNKPWRSIPRHYLRQVWWQQYVLGAERTLVVWEQHEDFVPVHAEPLCRWVDRDDEQIRALVGMADRLVEELRRRPPAPGNARITAPRHSAGIDQLPSGSRAASGRRPAHAKTAAGISRRRRPLAPRRGYFFAPATCATGAGNASGCLVCRSCTSFSRT